MSEIGERIRIHTGDITRLAVDAIVNAANSSLPGGETAELYRRAVAGLEGR